MDAFIWGRPVLVPDLADVREVRWPGFAADAVAAGVAAVFAFPLRIGAIRLGVLDLGECAQPDERLHYVDAQLHHRHPGRLVDL